MDQREAKRMARRLVADLIDAQLCAGWPFEAEPYENFSDDDQRRLADALEALRDKLGDNSQP